MIPEAIVIFSVGYLFSGALFLIFAGKLSCHRKDGKPCSMMEEIMVFTIAVLIWPYILSKILF